MASSQVQLAASPYEHVLRDHNRRIRGDRERDCTGSKSQSAAFSRNLKELVRDHFNTSKIILPSGPRDENSKLDENSHYGGGGGGCVGGGDLSSSSANNWPETRSKRQSRRILDRWAERQAQEMITSIERQTHEAEIMALSSNSQPVSERASSFMRDSSPVASESSVDLPDLRASSLVQMWKEFEAEGMSPRINISSPCTATCANRMSSPMTINVDNSEPSESAMDERYEALAAAAAAAANEDSFADWESDQSQTTQSGHLSSSLGLVSDANERMRVSDIIRRLSNTNQTGSSFTSWSAENDQEQRPSLDQSDISENEHRDLLCHIATPTPRLRGRQAFADLLMQLERERHRELDRLVEHHAVSRFPQRGRIKSLLRLRFLQREVTVRDQQHSFSRVSSWNQLCGRTPILRLRERFSSSRVERDGAIPTKQDSLQSLIQSSNTTLDSQQSGGSSQLTNEGAQQPAIPTLEHNTSLIHLTIPPIREQDTPRADEAVTSMNERQQQHERQSLDVIRQGTNSSVGNLDLHGHNDSERNSNSDSEENPHIWEGDATAVETENDTTQLAVGSYDSWEAITQARGSNNTRMQEAAEGRWLGDVSHSRGDWEGSGQGWFRDGFENNSQDEEIDDLPQRITVSSLLSSGFRSRMERLLLRNLRRHETIDENEEEDEDSISGRQYHEEGDDEPDPVASSSLQLPLPSRLSSFNDCYEDQMAGIDSDQGADTSFQLTQASPSDYQASQRCFPFTNHPSFEMELICDLRGHLARLHREISESQKLIESCMGMQVKLQKSIKQEVSAAVSCSIRGGEAAESSIKVPVKKGNCCICYEMQVDSLLYRCGHMCTCFKCAHELQWSSSRCPICRAPILDVVRAYSNT